MRRSERYAFVSLALWAAVSGPACAAGEAAAFRYRAPIEVGKAAPFVQIALPPSVYGHVEQAELRDLRVVDASGERVPFALLGARSEVQTSERRHEATLYPLPTRPGRDGAWQAPVDIVVDGDRIQVHKGRAIAGVAANTAAPATRPGGWLIDLGERKPDEAAPGSLRLRWTGPAEFTAVYRIETSDDLRSWRPGGTGQLMALASASGPLTQPTVLLPERSGRFVRLLWADLAEAPSLSGAEALATERNSVSLDAPSEIVVAPIAAPTDAATQAGPAPGALYFDLGGTLPVSQVDLRFGSGTRIAPVRVQARNRASDGWRDVAQGVFYRLDRAGVVEASPPLAVSQTVRFVRIVPDARAAALPADSTRLAVSAQLARLVFATQGQAPFALLAGAADAPAGALPVRSLVPAIDEERPRFGEAALGPWSEVTEVAQRAESERRTAQWRPWALWSVLIAGVAGLGFMVWRLARGAALPAPAADAGVTTGKPG
ncbi:MAG: DUF3999 family protein [Caldimonas sp.]